MTSPTPHEPPAGLPDQSLDLSEDRSPRTQAEPPVDPATEPDRAPAAGLDRRGRVRRTRASGLWVGLVGAAVLSLAFLVFIVQNSEKVDIRFLGFEGRLSLAVALLLSAVIGVLVVAVPGAVRISQLRRALRKNARS